MSKTQIFISYSHPDEKYKNELISHLRLLEREGIISVWEDNDISSGGEWRKEIEDAMNKSEMAILLISPNFLASDFLTSIELPALLNRAKSKDFALFPLLVRPAPWQLLPELAEYQFLNDVRKPLSTVRDRDEIYSRIVKQIADLALARRESNIYKNETATVKNIESQEKDLKFRGQVFLSYCGNDGDFAELVKFRLEREGIQTWMDNDGLEPGVDWRQDIDDAIRQSIALIAIMSPEARESEYVTYEWAFAWGVGIYIIPVMLKQTPLHPRLAILQYLDFTNRVARPWESLIKKIISRTNNK